MDFRRDRTYKGLGFGLGGKKRTQSLFHTIVPPYFVHIWLFETHCSLPLTAFFALSNFFILTFSWFFFGIFSLFCYFDVVLFGPGAGRMGGKVLWSREKVSGRHTRVE